TVKSFSCEPKQVCNRCEGTSVCSDCEATGKEYCGKCNGKGKIEKTDYHNNKPRQVVKSCNQCKGTGYISCKTCRGNGKCQKCKGTGKITCLTCKGKGVYQKYNWYSDVYKTEEASYKYSAHDYLTKTLKKTKNNKAFDEILF